MPLGLGALLVLTIDLFTEQGPAGSLAYEPPEANLMDRPPRNIKKSRLVSFGLLAYSYLIVGSVEAACCFGAYLWCFSLDDVHPRDIFWLDPKFTIWVTKADFIGDNIAYSGGKAFNAEEQASIVRQVHTLYNFKIDEIVLLDTSILSARYILDILSG